MPQFSVVPLDRPPIDVAAVLLVVRMVLFKARKLAESIAAVGRTQVRWAAAKRLRSTEGISPPTWLWS